MGPDASILPIRYMGQPKNSFLFFLMFFIFLVWFNPAEYIVVIGGTQCNVKHGPIFVGHNFLNVERIKVEKAKRVKIGEWLSGKEKNHVREERKPTFKEGFGLKAFKA